MILYFTNSSRQKKILADTDYVEDVYDEILGFFEYHKIKPHFIKLDKMDAGYKVCWNSQSEYFGCEGITADEVQTLKKLFMS